MSAFAFIGKIPASKSMLNRALLVKSYFPEIEIRGDSDADDVRLMKNAILALGPKSEIACGAAGTVLRFMAIRASREPGHHTLHGETRLFERPQDELIKILRQLGVEATLHADRLEIVSQGWRLQGDTLLVSTSRSSQFATSVLLNAWDLPFDLFVSLGGRKISEGYWRMSVAMAQELGMRMDQWDGDFRVPKGQKARGAVTAEIDMSSAFAIAALAAVGGRASILEFPDRSHQPDAIFPQILARMGVPMSLANGTLKVEKAVQLNGVAANLSSAPDLFPVLAILCALAEGPSDLYGAPQLVHKESNRLARIADWIKELGREVVVKEDGLEIKGSPPKPRAIKLKTDRDHRLAFAAATLKAAGFDVELDDPNVVSKSFPEFWSIVGWKM